MDNKELYGGIVIDGLILNKDMFYYRIPPFFYHSVKIGSRVIVPFGGKNEFHSGFVFDITDTLPKDIKEIKDISAVAETPLFDKNIRDLFLFTAKEYLIPLHLLVNQFIKTIVQKRYKKYIRCTDLEKLRELIKNSKGNKKEFLQYLSEKEFTSLLAIKRNFGNAGLRWVGELVHLYIVERTVIESRTITRYITFAKDERTAKTIIQNIGRKFISSAALIYTRLKNTKTLVSDERSLIKGIKYGRETLELLLANNVLKEVPFSIKDSIKKNKKPLKPYFIQGGSLRERNKQIIDIIKKEVPNNGKVLIVFPELSLIQRVEDEYRKAFPESVFAWKGKSKRNLLEEVNVLGKRIVLATPFSLFMKINDLSLIVIENASSRYFKQSDFLPFNTLLVALKKAALENTGLIFSSVIPEENIFFLSKKGEVVTKIGKELEPNIRIVDMRREFKHHNRRMLSRYLMQQMKKVLDKQGNVALLLNRKAYATFIMCRECGYVMKCPNCNVSLYYDKEKNKLVCPICGYETDPVDVCPRCGSPSIQYFGGGIQKLIEQVRKIFPSARIVKMMSSERPSERKIIDSANYKNTVFIGTEFLLSYLNMDNIDLFGFVSLDVFLHHFAFDAAMHTLQVVSEAFGEMNKKEIIAQTYLPEHYVMDAIKNMDYKHFFKEEFWMREQLSYPPFGNLIIFTFKGKEKYKTLEAALDFKKVFSEKFKDKIEILGPSPAPIEKKYGYYFYELSIKTKMKVYTLRETYFDFIKDKSIEIHSEVYPVPGIKQ